MGLEAATFISGLNVNNPVNATDSVNEGDDHIRLIKSTLLNTFPNITGAMNVSHTELNHLVGITGKTGTGNVVLSASPTFTGTITGLAGSGANLTALNATQLTNGTVPDARIGATSVTQHQASINHDALLNFVANEHINHASVSITAGAGLTGGGTIAATRNLDVGAGDGITVNANDVAVDSTVVRTSGAQTIGGAKTFSGDATFTGALEVQDDFVTSGRITNGSDGVLNDVAITNASIIEFTTLAGVVTLTGLAGGTDGRRVIVFNSTGFTMNLSRQAASSAAANRFEWSTADAIIQLDQFDAVEFVYNGNRSRWHVLARAMA